MKDDFNGTNEQLCSNIEALLALDAAGALVPHGVGGHARTMLSAAASRLRAQPERKLTDAELDDMAFGYAPSCPIGDLRSFARALLATHPAASWSLDLSKCQMEPLQPAIAPAIVAQPSDLPRCQTCALRPHCSNPNNPLCSSWITKAAQPAAATVPDEATISQTFNPRELVTLNGVQVKDLLDAVTGENGPDPETEITLIAHDTPFKSTDGEDMPAGTYFYWNEYPEEGIVLLDGTEQPPAAQAQDDGEGGQE